MPIEALLDQGGFDLARVLATTPDFLEHEEHGHDEDVSSMSFSLDAKLDPQRFNAWISLILQERGGDLLRTKGILDFKGEDRRYAFQAVHMMAEGDFIGPWRPGEARSSRLVFIGRNLNRPVFRRGFEGCVA